MLVITSPIESGALPSEPAFAITSSRLPVRFPLSVAFKGALKG